MYLYEKINRNECLPIKFLDLFYETPGETILKHWHNSIEILIPIFGDVEIWDNGDVTRVDKRKIYIINSRHVHGITLLKCDSLYKGYGLQINLDYVKQFFPSLDDYMFEQPNEIIANKLLELIYKMIAIYDKQDKYYYIALKGLTDVLIYLLLNNLLVSKSYLGKSEIITSDMNIAKFMKYIDKTYNEDISLQMIADHFHISNSYLSRYFKQHTGMTVKEYIDIVRFKNAYHDIVHTDMSILDIAYKNGFSDSKSLNRLFKKYYHKTPKQYREFMK